MNIVVLCGGYSVERDVSLKSGSLAAAALRERGHNVVLIDSFFGYTGEYSSPSELFERPYEDGAFTIGETAPDLERLKKARKQNNDSRIGANVIEICRCADIVFMALHGEDGENGKLQALFDVEGIKYTGSGYIGSALAMNKGLSKIMFKEAAIPTPDSAVVHKGGERGGVGFPCVVKPLSGGSSVGISIVENRDKYDEALDSAFKYENTVLVEKYIKGREFTVGVLGCKAMPVIEIVPKHGFYDYKNKYQAGLTEELCPAPLSRSLTSKLQSLAVKAGRALMIDTYFRADFLMDQDENFYCLEANTLPGMTPTSLIPRMAKEMGLDYGQLCDEIIRLSLKRFS